MGSITASASADRLCKGDHQLESAENVIGHSLERRNCFLQAQSQKVAKVNELASLRTDLKHERAENMVLREKLCEICLQLDDVATAKEAGEEEHSMTEQVHIVVKCCTVFARAQPVSNQAELDIHSVNGAASVPS